MIFGLTYLKIAMLGFAIFMAGFIDSIAGGGGVISLPAYLLTGLPAQTAFACNKTSACMGSSVACLRYMKSGKVNWPAAVASAITAIIGAGLASRIVLVLDASIFKKLIVCVLPFVAVFLIFKRDFGSGEEKEETNMKKILIVSLLIGLIIGFYDGLIGPGTGTFAILAFSQFLKMDLKRAGGTAKIFNWASNLSSTVSFLFAGKIIWGLALITAACNMAGNYVGAGMAIKKDPKFIRVMLTVVCTLLLVKLGYDVFF